MHSGVLPLVICIFLLPLMRYLTRAAGADKIMSFGKKPASSTMKIDKNTFPLAMGLIILAILAFFVAPLTALIIVGFVARRGFRMLVWAIKKIMLKERSPAFLQAAVPAKLLAAGMLLITCCGLAIYCCYWLETQTRRFDSTPINIFRTCTAETVELKFRTSTELHHQSPG